MKDPSEDPEAFWALFADELNDPNALSLEEVQRAMPVHGDTRETMIARNNRNNPKRLTNAELAAEYWRADGDQFAICEGITWEGQVGEWPTGEKAALHRQRILEQFVTLPHYDEVPE